MLAISDSKIIIRISALINTVRRSGCADGHDGGRSLSTLCPSNLLDGDHFRWKNGVFY
ncbi:chalcone synthase 2 [Nicotiana attenuata]|uniref:Chalcone synthase 2 n=1 Tax=Nicotiana attenuata TaxID=49451 RepID=A0A1J6KSC3_NICAT|nr:chalcone synthase 2 [Nicotiana attenuata]OIT25715.1 chalcone synthase 2 [Nicotiana attenuata]